jgi:hypothetical protein
VAVATAAADTHPAVADTVAAVAGISAVAAARIQVLVVIQPATGEDGPAPAVIALGADRTVTPRAVVTAGVIPITGTAWVWEQGWVSDTA